MKLIHIITLGFIPFGAIADVPGQDVRSKVVSVLYQPDLAPTEFDFYADGYTHQCGGSALRVRSSTVDITNRKFSLLSTALVSGKKISFRETGVCISGGRMEVSWVQLLK